MCTFFNYAGSILKKQLESVLYFEYSHTQYCLAIIVYHNIAQPLNFLCMDAIL